ncbi:MAG: hypothetical protein GKR95_09970 [Gammaproteobacteria bacterium]|nr:hypothetical protein [Gammaproteobacteria bacterium]
MLRSKFECLGNAWILTLDRRADPDTGKNVNTIDNRSPQWKNKTLSTLRLRIYSYTNMTLDIDSVAIQVRTGFCPLFF